MVENILIRNTDNGFVNLVSRLNVGNGPETSTVLKEILRIILDIPESTEEFMKAGLLNNMREIMNKESDPRILCDVCWILTNISACPMIPAVLWEYFTEDLVELMHWTADLELSAQAVWALGNIAGDGHIACHYLWERNVHYDIIERLTSLHMIYDSNDQSHRALASNGIWALQNICRYMSFPTLEDLRFLLDIMMKFLGPSQEFFGQTSTFIRDISFGLQCLMRTDQRMVQAVYQYRDILMQSLTDTWNVLDAWRLIRVIGILVADVHHFEYTTWALDNGILSIIERWWGIREKMDTDMVWVLSNIAAGSPKQGKVLLDSKLWEHLLDDLDRPGLSEKANLEIGWVLYNLLIVQGDDFLDAVETRTTHELAERISRHLLSSIYPKVRSNGLEMLDTILSIRGSKAARQMIRLNVDLQLRDMRRNSTSPADECHPWITHVLEEINRHCEGVHF